MTSATVAVEVAEGIHLIALPTPFIVGRVNTYLIEGDPLTLVDTGPNSGSSLDELERAMSGLGRGLDSIGRIIITHQHVDHAGLAAIIQRRSGATVEMLDLLAPVLGDWPAAAERDDETAMSLMRASGLGSDVIIALAAVGRSYRAFGSSVESPVTFSAGSTIAIGGREWDVRHLPGHSPSDTTFHDREGRILIGGDHLLEKVSSNPLISAPLPGTEGDGSRPRPLPEYLRNLRETSSLGIDLVLPGHGEPFGNHSAVVEERFDMHHRRAEKLLAALSSGPRTAFELAEGMWGRLAVAQAYLTLSEVLGHMDLLGEEGAVEELEPDSEGVTRFRAL